MYCVVQVKIIARASRTEASVCVCVFLFASTSLSFTAWENRDPVFWCLKAFFYGSELNEVNEVQVKFRGKARGPHRDRL